MRYPTISLELSVAKNQLRFFWDTKYTAVYVVELGRSLLKQMGVHL